MDINTKQLTATCCIVGGGPAGIMTGFLLARAGVDVIVLEKHNDFFRDFRGDTIHPSTFEVIYELGLLDEFLKVPHQEKQQLHIIYNNTQIHFADFSHLPVVRPAIGFMPQWDFLDFFVSQAKQYPTFKLLMNAEVTDVLWDKGNIIGVAADTSEGKVEVRAHLTIGCGGRHSVTRKIAGFEIATTGAPIDVLWFRLSKQQNDPSDIFGKFEQGKILVMIERDKYWQIGYVIPKGMYDKKRENGLEAFKKEIVAISSFLANRIDELKSWDDIKLLSVSIDHLVKWYRQGLLCIGDAAHTMSPIAGVGINLAIQDAIATVNILYQPLLQKNVTESDLQKIQERRQYPTRMTQRMQVIIQNGILKRQGAARNRLPLFFWLIKSIPLFRRIPARLVGMGFRPEHIKTPDMLRK